MRCRTKRSRSGRVDLRPAEVLLQISPRGFADPVPHCVAPASAIQTTGPRVVARSLRLIGTVMPGWRIVVGSSIVVSVGSRSVATHPEALRMRDHTRRGNDGGGKGSQCNQARNIVSSKAFDSLADRVDAVEMNGYGTQNSNAPTALNRTFTVTELSSSLQNAVYGERTSRPQFAPSPSSKVPDMSWRQLKPRAELP